MVFVGVSNNDTVQDGKAFVEEFGVPYPMAHAPEVWDLYDVPYQPVTIVIAPNGGIAHRFDGPVEGPDVAEILEKFV